MAILPLILYVGFTDTGLGCLQSWSVPGCPHREWADASRTLAETLARNSREVW